MPGPKVGDAAPEFDLPGTGDERYSLGRYRGKPVVLVFYPGDNTAVCTAQLKSYSSEIDGFNDLGAQVLGISPQDVASHEDFACKQGFAFPLLADVDKAVGHAYGVVGPLGFYRRCIFVVDGEGIIRYAHRSMTGLTFKPSKELLAAVQATQ